VGPFDGAALVHFIVVDQDAARGFDHAYAFQPVHSGVGAHVRVEDGRVGQQPLDLLQTVQQLDQPRIVVVKGTVDHGTEALAVFGQLAVGYRRSQLLGHVQARQGAHTVYARGVSLGLAIGRLQIRIAKRRFSDVPGVIGGGDVRRYRAAFGILEFQLAVVPFQAAGAVHQTRALVGSVPKFSISSVKRSSTV